MIRAFESIASYDFGTWMIGIMRSFISGGSAAVAGGLSVIGIDPEHFNLKPGAGLPDTMKVMITMFVIMGAYRMFEFLQLHGAPDQLQKTLDVAAKESSKAVAQAQAAQAAVTEAKQVASKEDNHP